MLDFILSNSVIFIIYFVLCFLGAIALYIKNTNITIDTNDVNYEFTKAGSLLFFILSFPFIAPIIMLIIVSVMIIIFAALCIFILLIIFGYLSDIILLGHGIFKKKNVKGDESH